MPSVVIDRDPDRGHELIAGGAVAVETHASSEDVLKRVGRAAAPGRIAPASTDAVTCSHGPMDEGATRSERVSPANPQHMSDRCESMPQADVVWKEKRTATFDP